MATVGSSASPVVSSSAGALRVHEAKIAGAGGRVVDSVGEPVAGAIVRLATRVPCERRMLHASRSVSIGTTRTGPDGRFTFPAMEVRGEGLGVAALHSSGERKLRGHAWRGEAIAEGSFVDLGIIEVHSPSHGFAELHVRVRCAEKLVVGAQVDVLFGYLDSGMSDIGSKAAETDGEGEVIFDLCASGLQVRITKAGFATEERAVRIVQEEDVSIDVELSPLRR